MNFLEFLFLRNLVIGVREVKWVWKGQQKLDGMQLFCGTQNVGVERDELGIH